MIELVDWRQRDSWSCGPVCASIVLNFFGRPIPREWPSTSSIDGTHPLALVPAFRRRGLCVLAGSCPQEVLATHVRNGNPAIALVQYSGESHYIVVQGYNRGVWFHCPVLGPKQRMNVADFKDIWYADGETPREFFQFAALVWKGT